MSAVDDLAAVQNGHATLPGISADTREAWLGPIADERELVPGLVPCGAFSLVAGGLGTFKTTLLHSMMLTYATGIDVLRLGVQVEPGPVVLLNYEDDDPRIWRRLQFLVQAHHDGLRRLGAHGDANRLVEGAVKNLRRITLTGSEDGVLVYSHERKYVRNRAAFDHIDAQVKSFAPNGRVMFALDPLRMATRGFSHNDDDGSDAMVSAMNALANSAPDSGLIVTSHTTKATGAGEAGEGRKMAYATSGSSLFSQHARSNFYVSRLTSTEIGKRLAGTKDVTPEEAQGEMVMQLTHARLSYGPESKHRYFVWRKGVLVLVRPDESVADPEQSQFLRAKKILPIIVKFIDESPTVRHSARALSNDPLLRRHGSRDTMRQVIDYAIGNGWLIAEGKTSTSSVSVSPIGRRSMPLTPTCATCAALAPVEIRPSRELDGRGIRVLARYPPLLRWRASSFDVVGGDKQGGKSKLARHLRGITNKAVDDYQKRQR